MHTHVCVLQQLMKTEVTRAQGSVWDGLGGGEGREKCYNYTIISK